jgi:hypothetical protein
MWAAAPELICQLLSVWSDLLLRLGLCDGHVVGEH